MLSLLKNINHWPLHNYSVVLICATVHAVLKILDGCKEITLLQIHKEYSQVAGIFHFNNKVLLMTRAMLFTF